MGLCEQLSAFADAFEDYLFGADRLPRLGHHMAHVAPENWLAVEFAHLFNNRARHFSMAGWSALLERKRVDVTLVPPAAEPRHDLPCDTVYIEMKLVATDWWNTAWPDVLSDLTALHTDGKPRKRPAATYAVCLLSNALSASAGRRREATRIKYAQYFARVPTSPGSFEPLPGGPLLFLAHTSRQHRLSWPGAVFERWPEGYEADARVIWVSLMPG